MTYKFLNIWSALLLIILVSPLSVKAQWGAPYTNNWINYNKPYVKVSVAQKGIHKISFASIPAGFPLDKPELLQLWHRGKQVAIISTDNKEIIFYGVPNDGASDSLLYRPMSSRLNPYFSMYSDRSAYFLTVGDVAGSRAPVINQAVDGSLAISKFHNQVATQIFKSEYSLSTSISIRPDFLNSFFENGASRTGVTVLGGQVTSYPFQLKNLYDLTTEKASIKLLVHGRSNNTRNIEVYVGKDAQSLRLVKAVANSNFTATEYSFDLLSSDVDSNGQGVLGLKSVSTSTLDRYSLAYFTTTYAQKPVVEDNIKSTEFRYDVSSANWTRIGITNVPANSKILDISDSDSPRTISGAATDFMVSRSVNKPLTLLVSNETITVADSSVTTPVVKKIEPKDYNYIIIASENLESGAMKYADYRSSAEGGGFKTVIVKIKDIYNQFNYGEPSPVAIRRFVDYMISDGNKDKFVFLFGKSITFNERMVRELPDEVPTIGFPGSDVLLVDGLGGTPVNVPSVSLGRLSAINNQHIEDYLQKVKDYEKNISGEFGWRKNILHLNGGKTAEEITQLKDMLASLVPLAEQGYVGGNVTPFVKQQAFNGVEAVNITPEVNAGVGLITYFGHGSTTVTDLNMGYSSDVDRGYNNAGKYPLMYFNGCGVGNIFTGFYTQSASSSTRMALSLDWMITPQKGAIAIVANTWDSYVSTSSNYLQELYDELFSSQDASKLPIGKIQIEVAKKVLGSSVSSYEIANIHQSLLQGDPALNLIHVSSPDYSVSPTGGILLYSESANKTIANSDTVRTAVIMSNLGRYIEGQLVPVQVIYYFKDGTKEAKSANFSAVPFKDTLFVVFPNKKQIQRIEVRLDPSNTITELSKDNNSSELDVDWDVAQGQNVYPTEATKDIIAPLLNVTFNNRVIQNGETVKPNPVISFILSDDRTLSLDSTSIDIYLKPCLDDKCDFRRLSYSSKDLKISALSTRSIPYYIRTFRYDIRKLFNVGKYKR